MRTNSYKMGTIHTGLLGTSGREMQKDGDLKSRGAQAPCRFESGPRYFSRKANKSRFSKVSSLFQLALTYARKGYKTGTIASMLIASIYIGSEAHASGCPLRFNTYYGHIADVQIYETPKLLRCNRPAFGKMQLGRISWNPNTGEHEWYKITSYANLEMSEATSFNLCTLDECWTVSYVDFMNSKGDKIAMHIIKNDAMPQSTHGQAKNNKDRVPVFIFKLTVDDSRGMWKVAGIK